MQKRNSSLSHQESRVEVEATGQRRYLQALGLQVRSEDSESIWKYAEYYYEQLELVTQRGECVFQEMNKTRSDAAYESQCCAAGREQVSELSAENATLRIRLDSQSTIQERAPVVTVPDRKFNQFRDQVLTRVADVALQRDEALAQAASLGDETT